MSKSIIRKIKSRLPHALRHDQTIIRREVKKIMQLRRSGVDDEKIAHKLIQLDKRIQSSIRQRTRRIQKMPALKFDPALPITAKKHEIIQAIKKNKVVIISGETGSGKTTQIPKFCMAAKRGIEGIIGCTQPRRIAATTVAQRIALELGEKIGQSVGYKIRFQDKTIPSNYIKIMTDGILLSETQTDRFLLRYDTIIVDEAHERSLNIDFILGILKNLLKSRNDLKVIITSATIDTKKFSETFNNAPIIEVSGRMFPVKMRYIDSLKILNDGKKPRDKNEQTHIDMAVSAIDQVLKESPDGDILIFMPTEQDIRETCEMIEGKNYKKIIVLKLFARLTAKEQINVFKTTASRKIIVATNIAETSITIPGIKYVVDTGLARISHYSPESRITSLPVKPISQSSADQRKGRCGRVENGICVRLYSEEDFLARPLFTPPEILRTNLAEVILRMMDLKLGNIANFPFIDKPNEKHIKDGNNLLSELGAIKLSRQIPDNRRQGSSEKLKTSHFFSLTKRGKLMAKISLDPRLSRILIEAEKEGCMLEATIIISALSAQDPRERPLEKEKEADQAHGIFRDPSSDFIVFLNIWDLYQKHFNRHKNLAGLKRFCRMHYLSFRRMREWRDIHFQILDILEKCGFKKEKFKARNKIKNASDLSDPIYTKIHRSLLSGFLSNIAVKKEKYFYMGTKGKNIMLFPGSGLFNHSGQWIVAAELVKTSRLFARTVANISDTWLEDLGGNLCKYTYFSAHWEKKRDEVVAFEQVSLFGLIIVEKRLVSYGPVNPEEARSIFIRSALVKADIKKPLPFLIYNQALIDSVRKDENKIRRRDLLISEDDIFNFYNTRVNNVYDIETLEKNISTKGNDDFLKMESDNLIKYEIEDKELSLFPDRIHLGTNPVDCSYRFRPGCDDDGVTFKIPASITSQVAEHSVDWLVPGMLKDKISFLIKGLPKKYRKKLVPVTNTVDIIVNEMDAFDGPLISALCKFIYKRFRVDIPLSVWQKVQLPEHLTARISVVEPSGRQISVSRDTSILGQEFIKNSLPKELQLQKEKWEKTGVTQWDFDDLPDMIHMEDKNKWIFYPGLQPSIKDNSVDLKLFESREKALKLHKNGVVALYKIYFSKEIKFLKKQLKLSPKSRLSTTHFGGPGRFEANIYDSVINSLFWKNIRSKNKFHRHAKAVKPLILINGRELMEKCIHLMTVYNETLTILLDHEKKTWSNKPLQAFLSQQKSELNRLVPKQFMKLYDVKRFPDIERFLKAMTIRIQRAVFNLEKDREKADRVEVFTNWMNNELKNLSKRASQEKKDEIEAFFWMLEEYKISVFAQELRTSIPVSQKRLQKKMKAIQRLP